MSNKPKTLVVFDFDWSFVDQDTDEYTLETLAIHLRRRMETLRRTTQWTDLVADGLKRLHEEGKTRQQIEGALQNVPLHPAMKRAVQDLKSSEKVDAQFLCLSNANSVFINTILKHHSLEYIFSNIITNPAEWRGELLHLQRRVPVDGVQHECQVGCSPNMCKGKELTEYLGGFATEYSQVVYVGDGSNDFCPILRLRSQDLALVRRNRELAARLERGGKSELKCQVHYWTGAWEVEEVFQAIGDLREIPYNGSDGGSKML